MWILLLAAMVNTYSMETYICKGSNESYSCYLYSPHEPKYLENVIHVHEADTSDSYGNPEPYKDDEPIDDWIDKYILKNKD